MNLHLKNVQTHVLGEIGETNNVTFFFLKKGRKVQTEQSIQGITERADITTSEYEEEKQLKEELKDSLQLLERCFGISSELQDAQGRVPHGSFRSPLKTKLADI